MKVEVKIKSENPAKTHRVSVLNGDFTMRNFKFLVSDAKAVTSMEILFGAQTLVKDSKVSGFSAELGDSGGFLVSSEIVSMWIPVASIFYHTIEFRINFSDDAELLGYVYDAEDITSDDETNQLKKPVMFGGDLLAACGFARRRRGADEVS